MSDLNFDFFKNVKVVEQEIATPKKRGAAKVEAPLGNTLRVYKDGTVIPSLDVVEAMNLEYQAEKEGNGLDVFSSELFTMVDFGDTKVLMMCVTPRVLPKVTLFAGCRYNEDKTPKTTLMTQGSTVGGKEVAALVESVYGKEIVTFVDLAFRDDAFVEAPHGVFMIPTVVKSGAKKGQPDYERRENSKIYPLVLVPSEEVVEEVVVEKEGTFDPLAEATEGGEMIPQAEEVAAEMGEEVEENTASAGSGAIMPGDDVIPGFPTEG